MRKFYNTGVVAALSALSLVLISCANSQGKTPKEPLGQISTGTIGNGAAAPATTTGGSSAAPTDGSSPNAPAGFQLLPSYASPTCVQGDGDYDNFNVTLTFSSSQMTETIQNLEDDCVTPSEPAITANYTYYWGGALSQPANSFIFNLKRSDGTWVYTAISSVQGGQGIQLGTDPGGSTPTSRPTSLDPTVYSSTEY
jgi:hypothetical protein